MTIPLEFNVFIFPRDDESVKDIPPDDQGIFSAKEVGEPPLILANAVFFAIKDAVRESRRERKLLTLFNMQAPATPQEVASACAVDFANFAARAVQPERLNWISNQAALSILALLFSLT